MGDAYVTCESSKYRTTFILFSFLYHFLIISLFLSLKVVEKAVILIIKRLIEFDIRIADVLAVLIFVSLFS